MAAVEGFGLWKVLDKDRNIDCETHGFIDLKQGYFFETDENRKATGRVFVLRHLGGWERVEESSESNGWQE